MTATSKRHVKITWVEIETNNAAMLGLDETMLTGWTLDECVRAATYLADTQGVDVSKYACAAEYVDDSQFGPTGECTMNELEKKVEDVIAPLTDIGPTMAVMRDKARTMTVDALAQRSGIVRNAIRRSLAALDELDELLAD